jgi:hypothetical protein
MAAPTIGLLNHVEIDDADANTSWVGVTTADPDIKKEGTNSMSGIVRTDLTLAYYDDTTTRSAVGKHIRMWVNTINTPYMKTEVNGGYEAYMYDGTNSDYYTIFGSDTYPGGWFNVVIDCSLFTGITLANARRWGIRSNHTTNAKNAINTWVDFIRYTDGYYITGGTSGDKVTLMDVSVADKGTTTLFGYGIIEEIEGVYFSSGKFQVGNGTTTTYFEMDGDVLVFTDKSVADGLYAINGNGSGCNLVINNSTIKASGTGNANRPDIDMVTNSPGSVSITDTVFIRAGLSSFTSGQTITGNTFNNCQQIIHGGSDMRGCTIAGYEGTADTAALFYNAAVDPDGEMDNMSFTKGTAATHAIEFGTSSPTTMTLRGIDFSGYNASNGQTDSTFLVSRTSGTVTINLVGCSGNMTYKSAGATVVLVQDPVTVLLTVKDIETNSVIVGARILLWVANGTNFPYQDSVSITSSGTTATVTHTGHGLSTNDNVIILGAVEEAYNGAYQITVTGVDTYTYTMVASTTTPATGTITSTFAIINTITDSNGQVSDSRTYPSGSQPVLGRVRRATTGTLYKQQPISDTVSNTVGLTSNILMIPDV